MLLILPVVLQEGRVKGHGRVKFSHGPGGVLESEVAFGGPACEQGLLGDEEVASAESGLAYVVVGALLEFVWLVVVIRDILSFLTGVSEIIDGFNKYLSWDCFQPKTDVPPVFYRKFLEIFFETLSLTLSSK